MSTAIRLTFILDEDVTPDIFAYRVAQACASGALRPGEGVVLPSNENRVITVTEEDVVPFRRPRPQPERPQ